MRPRRNFFLLLPALLLVFHPRLAIAQEGQSDPPPLQGASFLLEDANNQADGVVEHVLTFARTTGTSGWTLALTEEWPAGGPSNQLSLQVPWIRTDSAIGTSTSGPGDVTIGYRRQLGGGDRRWAVAPRVSLLLPTGDPASGTGAGGVGLQLGFPLTLALGEKIVTHTNVFATATLDARTPAGSHGDLLALGVGQGVVWNLHPRVNVTLESVWTRSRGFGPESAGSSVPTSTWVVSPGVQVMVDLPGGFPVVPGIAFPVGVGPSRGERGVVLFLGFQHALRRAAPPAALP